MFVESYENDEGNKVIHQPTNLKNSLVFLFQDEKLR